jgi:hypothetical protein
VIDPERLAALLDGRLGGAERSELLTQLAASDSAFEAYADAAAVVGELQAGPRHWQTPMRWIAIAAVLAGLALAPWLWMRMRSANRDDPGRFVALLAAPAGSVPAGWNADPWGTVRGSDQPLMATARAARLGARLTDLALAVQRRDTASATLAADIGALLEAVPAAGPVSAMYHEIGTRAGAAPSDLAPLLTRAGSATARLAGADLVQLGAWVEAARVAAATQDAAFFDSRQSRTMLVRASTLSGLAEPARSLVSRLQAKLSAERTPEWSALGRDLTQLLGTLGSSRMTDG